MVLWCTIFMVLLKSGRVFSILPQTTITIVGVVLHVYTYVCIWVKTGEYLAFFLGFVDL
jgi:hypothetical protein